MALLKTLKRTYDMERNTKPPAAWPWLMSFGFCLLFSQAQVYSQSNWETPYQSGCVTDGEVWCSSECESYYTNSGCNDPCTQCPSECDPCDECPCDDDSCRKVIEYVDYEPWLEGTDAGLHCLPGSNCTFSCPTKPSGAKLYRYQGRLVHKYRYGAEHPREDWRTIMLHMRVILPMTACSYRKILSFLQEVPYKPTKKPSLPKKAATDDASANLAAESTDTVDEDELIAANGEGDVDAGLSDYQAPSTDTPEDGLVNSEEPVLDDELGLEELIGDVNVADVEFIDTPVGGGGGWLPKFNHVFSGYMYLDYSSPTNSFFRDFNGNNTFSYVAAPVWLASYGDSLLYAMKVGAFNFGQETHFTLPYAYLSYFYNDYLTFTFGKYVIPFGSYFKYYIGWCEKMATPPLARTFFEDNTIVPNVDIGAIVSGAIPLCSLSKCFKQSTLTYEFWLGNGPSEVNAYTPNNDAPSEFNPLGVPYGTIYYNAGEGNAPNNNNSFAWGGRIGFLPTDCQIYGISYMKSRWTSNATNFGNLPFPSNITHGRKLNFEAAAFDWNIIFNQWVVFRGEYIWTQYENSIPEFPWVRQTAYWAMLAFDLGLLKCVCPKIYWCKPCFWDSLEFCVRADNLLRQPSGKSFYVGGTEYDYNPTGKAYDQKRFSLTLGYYFTQTFSAKVGYDFNYGDKGIYPTRAFLTQDPPPFKKTGFAENVFTFRIVYGW